MSPARDCAEGRDPPVLTISGLDDGDRDGDLADLCADDGEVERGDRRLGLSDRFCPGLDRLSGKAERVGEGDAVGDLDVALDDVIPLLRPRVVGTGDAPRRWRRFRAARLCGDVLNSTIGGASSESSDCDSTVASLLDAVRADALVTLRAVDARVRRVTGCDRFAVARPLVVRALPARAAGVPVVCGVAAARRGTVRLAAPLPLFRARVLGLLSAATISLRSKSSELRRTGCRLTRRDRSVGMPRAFELPRHTCRPPNLALGQLPPVPQHYTMLPKITTRRSTR